MTCVRNCSFFEKEKNKRGCLKFCIYVNLKLPTLKKFQLFNSEDLIIKFNHYA